MLVTVRTDHGLFALDLTKLKFIIYEGLEIVKISYNNKDYGILGTVIGLTEEALLSYLQENLSQVALK